MSDTKSCDRLLTIRQAAELVGGKHVRTVERWAANGIGGFPKLRKIANRNFVAESELAAFIAATANRAPAE